MRMEEGVSDYRKVATSDDTILPDIHGGEYVKSILLLR